jgi:hypothetical protein
VTQEKDFDLDSMGRFPYLYAGIVKHTGSIKKEVSVTE